MLTFTESLEAAKWCLTVGMYDMTALVIYNNLDLLIHQVNMVEVLRLH